MLWHREISCAAISLFVALLPLAISRVIRRACISPPKALAIAALITPSGAPPIPYITSIGLLGIVAYKEASTSPSGKVMTLIPLLRKSMIIS